MRWLIKASKSDENCNILRQFKTQKCVRILESVIKQIFLYCYFHILNQK